MVQPVWTRVKHACVSFLPFAPKLSRTIAVLPPRLPRSPKRKQQQQRKRRKRRKRRKQHVQCVVPFVVPCVLGGGRLLPRSVHVARWTFVCSTSPWCVGFGFSTAAIFFWIFPWLPIWSTTTSRPMVKKKHRETETPQSVYL